VDTACQNPKKKTIHFGVIEVQAIRERYMETIHICSEFLRAVIVTYLAKELLTQLVCVPDLAEEHSKVLKHGVGRQW
jgi:hypothetical protein